MTDDLATDAMERAVRAHAERFEYELRGAWRAGYDYLHVYDPPFHSRDVSGSYSIHTAVFPSFSETPPQVDDYHYRETYVLDITPEQMDDYRRRIQP